MGAHYTKETKRKKIDAIIALMQRGCSRREACIHLKIPVTTVQNWIKKDPRLEAEFQMAEDYLNVYAEKVIASDIIDKRNVDTAKWLLERTKKYKYSTRLEHTGQGGTPLFRGAQIIINRAKKTEDGKPNNNS